jgi:ferritin
MSPTLVTAFNCQANRELQTSLLMRALHYWADVHHHSGFAEFFDKQAEEEEGHAKQFFKHLADRDITPEVGPVEKQPSDFVDLVTVAKLLYDHERENTRAIHALYELALGERDFPAQVFLHPYISEQVEEEAWTDWLLERTRRATCAGGLFTLDRHLVKDLLGEK